MVLMPGTTSSGVPYPVGTDKVKDGPATFAALASWIDGAYEQGTLAARPSSSSTNVGRIYYATDTGDWALDSGAVWLPICSAARATSATGTGVASGSAAPIGTLTQTVSGAFSIASSTRLACTFAGTYRATFRLQTVSGLDTMSSAQVNKNMVQLHGQAAGSLARRVSICVDVAMSAGDYLEVVGTTSSGNHQLEWALIERVGP